METSENVGEGPPERKKEAELFAQIVKCLKENKDRSSIIRPLFSLVPDLETIPKEARQHVLLVSSSH